MGFSLTKIKEVLGRDRISQASAGNLRATATKTEPIIPGGGHAALPAPAESFRQEAPAGGCGIA
jgi:hypothetical protein